MGKGFAGMVAALHANVTGWHRGPLMGANRSGAVRRPAQRAEGFVRDAKHPQRLARIVPGSAR